MLVERVQPTIIIAGALYETDPVDCAPGTQAFLNSVIEIEAACTPQELHAHLQSIELAMGRPAIREKNSPRSLDLDVLLYGQARMDSPRLTLPHPRMWGRAFVVHPLADLAPDLVMPSHWASVAGQSIEAVSELVP